MAMCKGLVTKGTQANASIDRCWRKAGPSGYCWQHDPARLHEKATRSSLAQRMRQLTANLANDSLDLYSLERERLEAQSIMRALAELEGRSGG